MDERTVKRWLGRFNQLSIPSLAECPRKGRPSVYKAEEVSLVIEIDQARRSRLAPCLGCTVSSDVAAVLTIPSTRERAATPLVFRL